MNEKNISPTAVAVGVLAGLGIIYLAVQSGRKCTEFPEVWTDTNDLHMTEDAQTRALEEARGQVRAVLLADGAFSVADIQLKVAKKVSDCDWSERKTDKAKQVWEGIGGIVNHIIGEAKTNPEKFYG